MIDSFYCEFNSNTKILKIKHNNNTLISIPFKPTNNIINVCSLCRFVEYCKKPIFGIDSSFDFKTFCVKTPMGFVPDLKSAGIDEKDLYNRIRGNIVKKLPKPKKI